VPDLYYRVVRMARLAGLLYWVSASFVFLDDAGVGSLAAAFTDSFEDLRDRHGPGGGESSGGKMPPGR
jgi:hypothetical protein